MINTKSALLLGDWLGTSVYRLIRKTGWQNSENKLHQLMCDCLSHYYDSCTKGCCCGLNQRPFNQKAGVITTRPTCSSLYKRICTINVLCFIQQRDIALNSILRKTSKGEKKCLHRFWISFFTIPFMCYLCLLNPIWYTCIIYGGLISFSLSLCVCVFVCLYITFPMIPIR